MVFEVALPVFLSIYVATSIFFFYFPNLIHKKKDLGKLKSIVHISHRGGSIEAPENTMDAFRNADSAGTDMIELDLHLTKDGEVVVFHDSSVLRMTGVPERIAKLNYDELPPFLESIQVPFADFPGQSVQTVKFSPYVPKFEEVLQTFPNLPINFEIKDNSDVLIEKVNYLLIKYKRERTVAWGGFSKSVCDKCYRINPRVPLYFSFRGVAKILVLHYTGLISFVPIRESFLEIPSFSRLPLANIRATKRKEKWVARLLDTLLIRPSLFRHLNKRGILVFAWCFNIPEDFDYCFKKGFNGIMTDAPNALTEYLQDTGRK